MNDDDLQVINADGAAMSCLGTIHVCLQWDGQFIKDTVFVCNGMSTPCIAGYLLNDLHRCNCGRSTSTTDDVINVNAVSTMDSVMPSSEQLGMFATDGSIRPITGEEMHIHLQEGAIPFQVRKARPLPLAWRDTVNAELVTSCSTASSHRWAVNHRIGVTHL